MPTDGGSSSAATGAAAQLSEVIGRQCIGTMENFVPDENADFDIYLKRLEHFFRLNRVTDDAMKVSALITLGGQYCVKKLIAAIHPDTVESKTFKELADALKTKFTPRKNVVAERYKFFERRQEEDETINEFVTELQAMAQRCNFREYRVEALRDRIVCGVRSKRIQTCLLDKDRPFQETLDIALSMELAEENVKMIKPHVVGKMQGRKGTRKRSSSQSSHRSQKRTDKKKKHDRSSIRCFKCGKWSNHVAANCPEKPKSDRKEKDRKHKYSKRKQVKAVVESSSEASDSGSDRLGYRMHAMKLAVLRGSPLDRLDDEHKVGECNSSNDEKVIEEDFVDIQSVRVGETVSTIKTVTMSDREDPVFIDVCVGKIILRMEIDSGACVSVIHVKDFQKYLPGHILRKCEMNLRVVTGEFVQVLGAIRVPIEVQSQGKWKFVGNVDLVVVDSPKSFRPLCGRDWISVIFPDWKEYFGSKRVHSVKGKIINPSRECERVVKKYADVFDVNDTSPIKKFQANIVLKPDARPVFHKAYTLPFGVRKEVEEELDRLVNQGFLIPVSFSRWASPIVVVRKRNGTIRMCVDCKSTINRYVELAHYPLPRIDECFQPLAGCVYFCVLDLAGAYQQLSVHPDSQELLTINTHKGLFQFTRLIFGLNSSPAIFQSIMDRILEGIPHVICYIDDILIGGSTQRESEETLILVLERLRKFNVKANFKKCVFFKKEIQYLGHRLTKEGVRPVLDKLESIKKAPVPTNVKELKSYLGLLNYYGRFLPNLSPKLTPFYHLLKNDVPFEWTEEHQRVFEESKTWLRENSVLTHYQDHLPLIISVDASGNGVGGVLSHIIDGEERPILFVSSTLSSAEKNYSNVEREALALVFAVKRFHKYIYGKRVTVFTDHSSLRELFGDKKRNTNAIACARIARWAVQLSMYDLEIVHKKGTDNANADFLSRFPCKDSTGISELAINFLDVKGDLPVREKEIQEETQKDSILQQVAEWIENGFKINAKIDQGAIKPFKAIKTHLRVVDSIIFRGDRIVVPRTLRQQFIKLFHAGHEGIVRAKSLARGICWWPGINRDIENFVKSCQVCQEAAPKPRNLRLTPWTRTNAPWQRIHVDFFHFNGKFYLLVVDEFSKFLDVQMMTTTNAIATISVLRRLFIIFGLPVKVVSDNGPPFSSKLFGEFLTNNGIQHVTTPPYHPASNGLGERAVQTAKSSLKKFMRDEKLIKLTPELRVCHFLFRYNHTPSTQTDQSPMKMMLNYDPRTALTIRETNLVEENRVKNELKPGDEIYYYYNQEWLQGRVLERLSKVVFIIGVGNARIKVHRDQIKPRIGREMERGDLELSSKTDKKSRESAPVEKQTDNSENSDDDVFLSPPSTPRSQSPEVPALPPLISRRSSRLVSKKKINYKL